MNEINRLKTKYGNSIEEILEYCDKKEEMVIKTAGLRCLSGEVAEKNWRMPKQQ